MTLATERLDLDATPTRLIVDSSVRILEALAVEPGSPPWLNAAERSRLAAFKVQSAHDGFLAAHLAVRRCAGDLAGVPEDSFDVVQRCAHCDRPHGAPTIVGGTETRSVQVSMSHSRSWVATIAATRSVAIDIEVTERSAPMPHRFLHPVERRRLGTESSDDELVQLWSAKECLVKLGHTEVDRFASVDLSGLLGAPPDQTASIGGVRFLRRRLDGAILTIAFE